MLRDQFTQRDSTPARGWLACTVVTDGGLSWAEGHRGQLRRRQGPCGGRHSSTWGWRCSTTGWGWGASLSVLLAPRWRSSGGGNEQVTTVASKRSRHGGGGGGEGVLAQQQQGFGGGGIDDMVLAVAACTLVASIMVVRWQQRAREINFMKWFRPKGGSWIYSVKYQSWL
jgi:hypothetical protein